MNNVRVDRVRNTKRVMGSSMLKMGKYRHYKGKEYRVIGVAKHSETLDELVVYEALYDNTSSSLWVRPLAMFCENVLVDGVEMPRFSYCGD